MNLAQTLIADPTFNLMSRAEKLEEARALHITAGGEDDPLEIALAVEEAEGLLVSGFQPVQAQEVLSAGIEPCREDRASCASPVAGNGRCLECGARRALDRATLDAHEREDRARADAFVARIDAGETVSDMLAKAGQPKAVKPAAPILARFKAVTGHNDRDTGDLLNMARSTVQGTVSGRTPEKLTPAQLNKVYMTLLATAKAAQALALELEERISD